MRTHKQTGFTLIELVVAVFITAIIGVVAGSVMFTASGASESVDKHVDQFNQFNSFLLRFGRDMQHVVPRAVIVNGQALNAMQYSKDGEEQGLIFTHAGWINPAPELFQRTRLQRTAYFLRDNKLIRKTWTLLDNDGDDEGKEHELLENVEKFEFRFVPTMNIKNANATQNSSNQSRPITQKKGLEWVDTWPDQNSPAALSGAQLSRTAIPAAVEMKITLDAYGEVTRLYEIAHAP